MSVKKNWTMRAAVLMLALVLVTSCFVGGTFAKYTTKGEGSDTARVAMFGVRVEAKGTTFAEKYATDDGAASVGTHSVVSMWGDNVVAPGTTGDMTAIALGGKPEVAVRVNYTGNVQLSTNWTVDGQFYCPLEITVNNNTLKGTDYNDADTFVAAINNAISGYSKEYAAGTDLSANGADALKISWAWPFSTGDDNDVKDTALGNQAVVGNAATVTVDVTATVTQID